MRWASTHVEHQTLNAVVEIIPMWLDTLDQHLRASSQGYGYGNINDFWYAGAPMESDSGISITPDNAMRQSTTYKCVTWKASQFAKLPKKIYERVDDVTGKSGRREARGHRLYNVVHARPNPAVTSFVFFQQVSMDLDIEGNFYAYIQKDQFGRPVYLWRLLPDVSHMRITTKPVADPGAPGDKVAQVFYVATDMWGNETNFFQDEILHIRGLGFDGIRGFSPIRLMMNSLGWNRGTERYGAQFFKNASRPSGLLISPTTIKSPQREELIESLTNSGKRAGSLALIEGSLKYQKMTMDQDEAQFIETLEYQQEDICGIFGVKPHKVGIMRHMTNNNVEQQNIEAVTDTLHPMCEGVEQWMDFALLSDSPSTGFGGGAENDRFYFEFELKGLLRGDMAARSTYYQIMVNIGVMSPNDVADEENMDRFEGGDIHVMQLNMATLENIADPPVKALPPAPDSKEVPAEDSTDETPSKALLRERFQAAYIHVYRDAVGRIMTKKRPEDRARSAAKTFYSLFMGLAEGLGVKTLDVKFTTEYLGALALRVATWTNDLEGIAAAELNRAISVLI